MTEQVSPVTFSVADGIGRIRLNRPESLNAMDIEVASGFLGAVTALATDDAVRVIVLEAEGRSFMAGGDLGYFKTADDRGTAARVLIETVHRAILQLSAAPQITIAAVQGAAAGGGMSLALNFDLVVAADDALFNAAYGRIGTTPDCGGSWILPRLVGPRKAMEIALLCDNIAASEALRLGMVNRVVPRDRLQTEVEALARRLAAGAPIAQRNVKRLLSSADANTLEQQLAAEVDSFAECAATDDFGGAIAAFFEKKPYRFEGR